MPTEPEKNSKKTLFFLKSPKHNLSAIETFLKRRDFEVVSISDYKEAVGRLIPMNPDYVFLAWDHPQDQVINLPKLLAQSCTSKIIPFINSSDKMQHRKLQSASLNPKLFPPLSGPGIQRMIAKIEQSAIEAESEAQSKDNKRGTSAQGSAKKSDMIQVRSSFSGEDTNGKSNQRNEPTLELGENESNDNGMFREKTRADQLRDFQKGLSDLYKRKRSEPTLKYDEKPDSNATQSSGTTGEVNPSNPSSADLISLDESIDMVRNSGAFSAATNGNLFHKLKTSFDQEVAPELRDYFENFEDMKLNSSLENDTQFTTSNELQCLVVQSSTWIGYLVIQTELEMDRQTLEFILAKWIFENFGYNSSESVDLVNTSPLFTIRIKPVPFLAFAEKHADFRTGFEYDGKRLNLGFFSIDPEFIFLRLHQKHDMIELGIKELPFEQNLEFEVCLYMPENERFIVYSKRQSKIQKVHLDRLKDKSVKSVYTNFENEVAVQKFRAEFQMNLKVDFYLGLQAKENV